MADSDGNQLDEQVPVDQRADEWCVGEVGTTGVLTVEVEGGAPLVLEVRAGDEVLATSGEPRAGARLEVELDGRWQHLAIATPDDVEGEVRLRTSWTPTGD